MLKHDKMGTFLKNARMVQYLKINQQLILISIHGIKTTKKPVSNKA